MRVSASVRIQPLAPYTPHVSFVLLLKNGSGRKRRSGWDQVVAGESSDEINPSLTRGD